MQFRQRYPRHVKIRGQYTAIIEIGNRYRKAPEQTAAEKGQGYAADNLTRQRLCHPNPGAMTKHRLNGVTPRSSAVCGCVFLGIDKLTPRRHLARIQLSNLKRATVCLFWNGIQRHRRRFWGGLLLCKGLAQALFTL